MGANGSFNTSKSSSSASSQSYLSSLAETQEGILKSRESFFQDYFLPQFKEVYNLYNPDSEQGKSQMGLTANQINSSFDSAQKQTNQALAQRNMLNTGAGAALTAQNNRAKSSALANAYATQMANSNNQKASMLSNLQTIMPTPTNAAPTVSKSKSSSDSSSLGIAAGFSLI
jgi:hypothetical protein